MAGRVHAPRLRTEEGRFRSGVVVAGIAAVLVLGGAGSATYFVQATRHETQQATNETTYIMRTRHHGGSGIRSSDPAAFDVVAISPAPGQKSVAYSPLIRIRFSQPLGRHWSLPTLTPTTPGSWMRADSSTLEFRPKGSFLPFSKVTLTLSGGVAGMRDAAGVALTAQYRASFAIAGGSVLRLQQLLAELGYLPLDFEDGPTTVKQYSNVTSQTGPHHLIAAVGSSPGRVMNAASATSASNSLNGTSAPPDLAQLAMATLDAEATKPAAIELTPRPGLFSWRFPSIPSSLATSWKAGDYSVLVRGAVMAFESAHGLAADGDAGPKMWAALLDAISLRQVSSAPYDYIQVTTSSPESLHVWRDGKVIYQSLANTGIAEEPTAPGTFPVYLRYTSTTMSGHNPNGSYYDDPGVPYVAYFNGGDAVHGFLRGQYGFPQSLGCVELPYANAAVVFNYDPIGTLVNVS